MTPMLGGDFVHTMVPESVATSGCDDFLDIIIPSSGGMDLEWNLEDDDHADVATATAECYPQESIAYGLQNVSDASRCLAAQQRNLADQSTISRSLATTMTHCHPSPSPAAATIVAVKTEKEYPHLPNMSSVSHNLANVGALPQCNQRHARFTVSAVAVAEEVDYSQPFHFSPLTAAAPDATCRTKAIGSGSQRRRAIAATAEQMKKLEMRRAKNREAAERMRRRRREQTVGLEQSVKELTARVDELSAKLAATEAENQQLRTLNHLVFGSDGTMSSAAQPDGIVQVPATIPPCDHT